MVHIETSGTLESFRQFLVTSTCRSFMPESYLDDSEVFPEKEGEAGSIYVEAADKVTLKKIREITFINARDVLGIIYVSKSGNTQLKWRQIRGRIGKVTGEASANSLVNLLTARVISREYAEQLAQLSETREGFEVEHPVEQTPLEAEGLEAHDEAEQDEDEAVNVEGV